MLFSFLFFILIFFGLVFKALKQAFEIFCNKSIAGISMPELLATSCDNILKKGGGYEKLGDGDMEETLEKVIPNLTTYYFYNLASLPFK